jgi:hypothetical protein
MRLDCFRSAATTPSFEAAIAVLRSHFMAWPKREISERFVVLFVDNDTWGNSRSLNASRRTEHWRSQVRAVLPRGVEARPAVGTSEPRYCGMI